MALGWAESVQDSVKEQKDYLKVSATPLPRLHPWGSARFGSGLPLTSLDQDLSAPSHRGLSRVSAAFTQRPSGFRGVYQVRFGGRNEQG